MGEVTMKLAEDVFKRAVEGLYGLQDESDYTALVGPDKLTDEKYWRLVRIFDDRIVTEKELLSLYDDDFSRDFIKDLKELTGADGTKGLEERVKWLKDWSETGWSRTDYSEDAIAYMKQEIKILSAVKYIYTSSDRIDQNDKALEPLIDVAELNGEMPISFLAGLLDSTEAVTRENAAMVLSVAALYSYPSVAAMSVYIEALKNEEPVVREYAARIIGRAYDMTPSYRSAIILKDAAEEAIPLLAKLVGDDFYIVRAAAVAAIGSICVEMEDCKADVAIRPLVNLLNSQDKTVQKGPAISALAAIGPAAKREAVPVLVKLMSNPNLRDSAIEALGNILKGSNDPEMAYVVTRIRQELEEAIVFGREGTIYAAVKALGDIGPLAKDTVPTLVKAHKMFKKSFGYGTETSNIVGRGYPSCIGVTEKAIVNVLVE